ncbi:Arm DNA-binding domain-containing protein [Novosphingobium sp.]|uniref:Arm DNA-binding domain-containing protein n=1 Tax=Novosphingobium sp. TaxID=1874826 RepID=UPI0027329B9E|nr:Arm DNA-binding domain-containing protein [Novosphingobium sp.]MDP3908231.1 Arm DNA-binding domain-containing protein [Novosphingobium sp.]
MSDIASLEGAGRFCQCPQIAIKALEIKGFKPLDKAYRKADAKGLYLEVRPNGSKLWFYNFRVDGKEKRLGLGAWPDMGLADARTAHGAARQVVQAGHRRAPDCGYPTSRIAGTA